jgi:hypothetical protein
LPEKSSELALLAELALVAELVLVAGFARVVFFAAVERFAVDAREVEALAREVDALARDVDVLAFEPELALRVVPPLRLGGVLRARGMGLLSRGCERRDYLMRALAMPEASNTIRR